MSRTTILNSVWDSIEDVEQNTLDALLARCVAKLTKDVR
jgi:DNA-binding response OmpR family regulator